MAEGATNCTELESGAGEEYCLFVFPQGGGCRELAWEAGRRPFTP
jgi:hypothetical protein